MELSPIDSEGEAKYLTLVLSGLTRRVDDVLRAVDAALDDACPGPALRSGLRDSIGAILEAHLRGSSLGDRALERLRTAGAASYADGTLTDVLAIGAQSLLRAVGDQILEEADGVARERRVPGSIVSGFLRSALKRQAVIQDEVVASLRSGYDSEHHRPRDAPDLCRRLLLGHCHDEIELQREAKDCGLDLSRPLAVVVLAPADADRGEHALQAGAGMIAATHPGAMVALSNLRPAHLVIVIPAPEPDMWSQYRAELGRIAEDCVIHALCYDPVSTPMELAAHYELARRDLRLPSIVALAPGALGARDLAFYRMCSGGPIEDRYQFVHSVVLDLLADKKASTLLETLEALFRTGVNRPALAEALKVHENTVKNRLDRIVRLTGLDVERPEDLVQLYVAVRLRNVVSDAAGARPPRSPDVEHVGELFSDDSEEG